MTKIDFQLFAALHIDGIDDDVLKELEGEMPQEETQEADAQATEETQAEEPSDTNEEPMEEEQNATADADSDNKQVAENVPNNIPYARFKQENERRKAAERELAELRARYANPVPVQKAEQTVSLEEPTQKEVMQAVTEEAIKRAKNALGLSDEDVENLEFSDDFNTRMQFQTMVQRESNAILEQARRNAEARIAQENQVNETNAAFNKFVEDFQLLADADDRWKFISEERFLQLPVFEQGAIKSAFERLQARQATPGDYFLTMNYFERASKEYDARRKPSVQAKPPANAATKIKQAQALPKAPSVQGAMSTSGMTIDDIVELMNKPGSEGIDKIPPELWQKILKGEPIG